MLQLSSDNKLEEQQTKFEMLPAKSIYHPVEYNMRLPVGNTLKMITITMLHLK